MSSIMILVLGVAGLAFGWFVYSRYVAVHIYKLDPDFVTPAHELEDGVDYVPTNKYVLWGHHFTSVAGAAPIVGPAIAVYWGWVPAILWVILGTVFFAGVHDMGALWASTRHKGKSIGALSEDVIGSRTRSLYMVIVFLLLLMVNSVFAVVISGLFVKQPGSVFPAWSAIVVALIIGQLLHRKMFKLGILTTIGVIVLYLSIYVGSEMPLSLPEGLVPGLGVQAVWILILFLYAAIASMLPVWALLQPRDFINGMQLAVGLILLYGAVLIAGPEMTAPAFNEQASSPSIIPLLFVTIACGAVSGFHGIVASGTSSKQLNKEPDARFVGYLAALGEGSLALITLIAISGAALAATPEAWHELYHGFNQQGGAAPFVEGGSELIEMGWGLPAGLASTILATMVVLFAGTTMDSGVRLQRYIIQEWGEIYKISLFKNGVLATFIAVACCLALSFGAGGKEGTGGMIIWPLFGTTNQILAGMTLLVLTVMLIKMRRPSWVTMIPMVLVLAASCWAGVELTWKFFTESKWLLLGLNIIVLIVSLLVLLEAVAMIGQQRRERSNTG